MLEHCEKIALIFISINALYEIKGSIRVLLFTHIVTSCECIKSLIQGVVLENAEFHFTITHDVRIRSDTIFVAFDQIMNDVFAVFIDQINNFKINAEVLCDRTRIFDVLLGRAVSQRHFLIHPCANVRPRDSMPLLFK